MNDFKILIFYEIKMKAREIKSMVKNLFIGLLIMSIYIFVIFTLIIIIYRFEIFEFVKITKELGLGKSILVFHQALLISNIVELITNQKNLLVRKSKEGLYLPYKKREITKSFMVLGIPILLVVTLILGILLQKSIGPIVIGFLLYSIILFISLSYVKKKGSDFFAMVIYFATFRVSYLFIK